MKKIFLTLFVLVMFAGIACAAPLTDYSAGSFSIDYTYRHSLEAKADGVDLGGKFSANVHEWGVTAGLGSKLAIQYRQFQPYSSGMSIMGNPGYYNSAAYSSSSYVQRYDLTLHTKYNEANLLYQLNKNLAVFAGRVHYDLSGSATGTCLHSDNTSHSLGSYGPASKSDDIVQFGLVGVTPVFTNSKLYGIAAFGKDFQNLEAGFAYALNNNLDFNLSYRSLKFKNILTAGNYNIGATYEGFGTGLTYKF